MEDSEIKLLNLEDENLKLKERIIARNVEYAKNKKMNFMRLI